LHPVVCVPRPLFPVRDASKDLVGDTWSPRTRRWPPPPPMPWLCLALARKKTSQPPHAGYKSLPFFLLARGRRATASRHCRRLWPHGELHPPPAFTANPCCSHLPLAPLNLLHSLVAQAEPPHNGATASSGRRHRPPPCPHAGTPSTPTPATNVSVVSP
jgi:hypothetical protein